MRNYGSRNMNAKQKQVLAELQTWYETVKENIPWCETAESVVYEWGSDRMTNAMSRAGYGWSTLNDVMCMTPRGCKFIDTMAENLKF